jgi:hypothetical protein
VHRFPKSEYSSRRRKTIILKGIFIRIRPGFLFFHRKLHPAATQIACNRYTNASIFVSTAFAGITDEQLQNLFNNSVGFSLHHQNTDQSSA